ncbi:hypothetical protein GQ42DRAFT_164468, partial [Ramicandelaber brevisporus]
MSSTTAPTASTAGSAPRDNGFYTQLLQFAATPHIPGIFFSVSGKFLVIPSLHELDSQLRNFSEAAKTLPPGELEQVLPTAIPIPTTISVRANRKRNKNGRAAGAAKKVKTRQLSSYNSLRRQLTAYQFSAVKPDTFPKEEIPLLVPGHPLANASVLAELTKTSDKSRIWFHPHFSNKEYEHFKIPRHTRTAKSGRPSIKTTDAESVIMSAEEAKICAMSQAAERRRSESPRMQRRHRGLSAATIIKEEEEEESDEDGDIDGNGNGNGSADGSGSDFDSVADAVSQASIGRRGNKCNKHGKRNKRILSYNEALAQIGKERSSTTGSSNSGISSPDSMADQQSLHSCSMTPSQLPALSALPLFHPSTQIDFDALLGIRGSPFQNLTASLHPSNLSLFDFNTSVQSPAPAHQAWSPDSIGAATPPAPPAAPTWLTSLESTSLFPALSVPSTIAVATTTATSSLPVTCPLPTSMAPLPFTSAPLPPLHLLAQPLTLPQPQSQTVAAPVATTTTATATAAATMASLPPFFIGSGLDIFGFDTLAIPRTES